MSTHSGPLFNSRAVGIARRALEELGEGEVGSHIGVTVTGKNVVTHHFAASMPGYRGWEWIAVLACAEGSTWITVNEVALMPGRDALQAPEWIPYEDRVRPGDLGPGDIFPPRPDDERLTDAPADSSRKKQLTDKGLQDSLQRWRTGAFGPTSEHAEKAQLHCRSCAFWLPVGSKIGDNFGVCVNEYSADGRVVHSAYGCGAHSDTPIEEHSSLNDNQPYDDEKAIEIKLER